MTISLNFIWNRVDITQLCGYQPKFLQFFSKITRRKQNQEIALSKITFTQDDEQNE